MLPRVDDVMLMAYVDGEVDSETAHEIERAIAKDPSVARRARALRDSAAFARAAFSEALHEPIPDRLLAALGATAAAAAAAQALTQAAAPAAPAAAPVPPAAAPAAANVVPFPLRRAGLGGGMAAKAIAASVVAVTVGLAAAYQGGYLQQQAAAPAVTNVATNAPAEAARTPAMGERWLDHVAGFYREYATTLQREQRLLVDFSGEHIRELEQWFSQRLNRQLNVPDLSPHGYQPQGGRMLIINGRPAAHLLYVGRTGDLVGVVIAFSEGETTPGRLATRDSVNIVYWREQGYAYAFVGTQPAELLWRMADQTWSSLAPI
ncbi:MAG: hypothetical protein JNL66_02735 [Alphaproteobacteria bacterium]|nr:hypothetical protein [Alphaproteobacteria bacterium]